MTEQEAKTKWCPHVRFHNGFDGDVYTSRPTGIATDDYANCIASDYMMWKDTYIDEYGMNGRCGLINNI